MTAFSSPVALVLAGVSQAPAGGLQWEGGCGTLFVSAISGTPLFQCSIDGGVTWLPIQNASNGAITAIAADGAYLYQLAPSRIRMSAGGGAMNASFART